MRRFFVLLSAAVLALAVAAPAVAAPTLDGNKHLGTMLIDCRSSEPVELGIFTVVAKSVPGWPTDSEGYKTNIHFRAADSVTWWYLGDIVWGPIEVTAPPGLDEKLVGPCQMHVDGGSRATFDIEFVNAYYVLPRPLE